MKQIRITLTEKDEQKITKKMASYKFNGSIHKFAKKLLLQGSNHDKNVRYVEQVYHYDFLLTRLDEILDSEPILLRSNLFDFKQELIEKMNKDIQL